MPDLNIGNPAPDFTLPTDDGKTVTLSALTGKPVVLYFYPKDDTPGCTTESCDFRDALPDFSKLKAVVIGISKDSVESHRKFKAKHKLSFPLASDEGGKILEAYGVWREKIMFKKYFGIERSTFLIDGNGIIRHIWRKVKVPGHVQEVLKALKEI